MFKEDIDKIVCEYLGIDYEQREKWLKRRDELQQLKIKLEHQVRMLQFCIVVTFRSLYQQFIIVRICQTVDKDANKWFTELFFLGFTNTQVKQCCPEILEHQVRMLQFCIVVTFRSLYQQFIIVRICQTVDKDANKWFTELFSWVLPIHK